MAMTPETEFDTDFKASTTKMDARNLNVNVNPNASASVEWMEWIRLMGYAGLVAVAVSCSLGAAVVLLGS